MSKHQNIVHEVVEAMNDRPEVLQIQPDRSRGPYGARVTKGSWTIQIGEPSRNITDHHIMDMYFRAIQFNRQMAPPLVIVTVPGFKGSKAIIPRQQIAVLPATVLLDRLRVPRADETPWSVF